LSTWQPTGSLKALKLRADFYAKIRHFFAERHVLEVETPLLSHTTTPDRYIQSFQTTYQGRHPQTLYLQTSPEFAMKRLLAIGSGAIYQICKAFRNDGESGQHHNPEFSLLEWYRPGFDHHKLMDEVDTLLNTLLGSLPAVRLSYKELFEWHVGFDPHCADLKTVQSTAQRLQIQVHEPEHLDHDGWLDVLMTDTIERHFKTSQPLFLYNFPASQASLARIQEGVAERVEVYVCGLELANGFHELANPFEQRQRFMKELKQRVKQGRPPVPLDERLLAALEHGIPNCAGMALGLDRLLMLAQNTDQIDAVLSFPLSRA
jgi:lysyl-tRNA synthetase class 2